MGTVPVMLTALLLVIAMVATVPCIIILTERLDATIMRWMRGCGGPQRPGRSAAPDLDHLARALDERRFYQRETMRLRDDRLLLLQEIAWLQEVIEELRSDHADVGGTPRPTEPTKLRIVWPTEKRTGTS